MVAAALARQGFTVSLPIGENARYDMVIEKDGALSRIKPSASDREEYLISSNRLRV
jgi:hypothetical protein